jgi:DNA replication protein DnaC
MQQIASPVRQIQERIQKIRLDMTATMTISPDSLATDPYQCTTCKDVGYLIQNWSVGVATACSCLEVKRLNARFRSAMIPDEFQQATIRGYRVMNPAQQTLYDAAVDYVKAFEQIRQTSSNSLGFLAAFGEQRLKEMSKEKRIMAKRRHNNYGLGKTHLQVAIAKQLIKKGISVLVVSDVALMEELMAAKMMDDKTAFTKRIDSIIQVPVLVWDDIGKANPTEAKRSVYFQIINERYKAQRPILFSTNEDSETLADRIGDAAASRLLGMAKGRNIRVEGPDYRLSGEVS